MADTGVKKESRKKSAPDESFRDRIATVDAEGKRKWVYAQKPKGKLYNIRSWVSWGFFALFFALPFITVHGRPLFLFNIPDAQFIIFGKIFWPQDFFIFGVMMLTFIIFIVLFTAAFGRLFCGWVCPHTIFMEMLFRKVEWLIEGDAPRQRLLNKGPWTTEKIGKKTIKHTAFFAMSFIIANFFLSYVIGIREVGKIISEPVSDHWVGFAGILLFAGIFYGVHAFFREQVCTVVCPYGRLQSVLIDRNTMVVAYDYERGEPRSKFTKEKVAGINTGDCIDCFQCVKVCPTNIDIRNGTQMECVGCTACIDACNRMMAAIGQPTGLIRYASENGIAEKKKLRYTGRMKFYTILLVVLAGLLTTLLVTRKDIDGTITRATGLLYQERGTDSLSNLFNIEIQNKTIRAIPLQLKLEGEFAGVGKIELVGTPRINVKKEGLGAGTFFIVLPRDAVKSRKIELHVGLYAGDKKITELETNFMGPFGSF